MREEEQERMANIPNNIYFGEQYINLGVIGDGAIGKCYLINEYQSNTKRVIKVIKESKVWDNINAKAKKLLEIEHNNIVKVLRVEDINGYHCIIQEYVAGNGLDTLGKESKVTVKICLRILEDILSALQYMQINDLSHKDIKPSNIIYDATIEKATLVDLDYTMIENEHYKKFFGTIKYSAPEQVMKNETSIGADCYSLGLVLCYLLIGDIPFSVDIRNNNRLILERLQSVLVKDYEQQAYIGKRLFELLKSMLVFDSHKRKNVVDILKLVKEIKNECTDAEMDVILRDTNYIFPREKKEIYNQISLIEKTFAYVATTAEISLCNSVTEVDVTSKRAKERVKKESSNNKRKGSYRSQLVAEYDNILLQAQIAFGLWVAAVVMCFLIVILSLFFVAKGRYIQGAMVAVLDAFVVAIQKIFYVREDHYRKLVDQKLKHLEDGDSLEYVFEKAEYLDDPIARNREAMKLLKRIKEYSKSDSK